MGKDFEIVVYRGTPASLAELAALIQRFTPYAELFRHSVASKLKAPLAPDLHCIAFYEDATGDGDDEDDEEDHDGDGATASAGKAYYSESMLEQVKSSTGGDRSLAALVQSAWSATRAAARPTRQPGDDADDSSEESDCAALARELSRIGGEAFLVGYGDHSCIGIYAQFRNGAIVSPDSLDDVYAEHDDYVGWPARQLSAALGTTIEIDELAELYFPDASQPPLYRPDRPTRAIDFDPDRYAMGLSESM